MALENIGFRTMGNTSFDPVAFERLKAADENKRPKKDDGLGVPCEKCGGGGYLLDVREDGSRYTKPCSCTPLREARARLKNVGMLERAERDTFPAFIAREPYQREMKEKAMAFCREEKKGWLMLCGQTGCGKTHLCVAVLGQLAKQGYSIQVMPWVNVAMSLKNPDADREAILKPYQTAQVLYIDDFLKGDPTRTGFDAAFTVLNDRYNDQKLITIISTERTPEELGKFDKAIRGRIAERCGVTKYLCVVATAPERDYRLRGAQSV